VKDPAGWVRALAPCKVNPWLFVRQKRPDGYHEVDLGFLALDLCDRIAVRAVPGGDGVRGIEVGGPEAGPDVPRDATNLAWRAAAAVLALARGAGAVREPLALELRLEKHVPSGAGLGGGSSDAAAAALATAAALEFEPERERWLALLAALGSDCAFFSAAAGTGFARGLGRGEEIQVLPGIDRNWHVALVVPASRASTAAVYAHFPSSLRSGAAAPTVPLDLFDRPLADARAALENELEDAAQRAVPELRSWRMLLDASGAGHFRLSGSGSGFFGLFRDPGPLRACLEEVRRNARSEGLLLRCSLATRPFGGGARLATLSWT
jgi:4-diphosphocytidyl-2-C-methyl-D-erythritol kinase